MMEQKQAVRHGVLQGPYRLLFLFAAIHAALVPIVWLLPEIGGFSPAAFHSHELVYGTIWAMVGGYVLTALSSWNRVFRPSAALSAFAACLWLFDRLAPNAMELVFEEPLFQIPSIFPLFLVVQVAATLPGKLKFVPIAILGLMSAMWLSSSFGAPALGGAGGLFPASMRDVLLVAALVTVVGGRAVPAFASFWVPDPPAAKTKSRDRWLEVESLAVFAAAMLSHIFEQDRLAGLAFIVTAAMLALRLFGWRWRVAFTYPALLMLFMAWLWLPVGLLLVGLTLFDDDPGALPTRMHALAIGGIGSMSYAMMARSCMKRANGRLIPAPATVSGFVLVQLSAFVRVFVAAQPGLFDAAISISAATWSVGWLLFLVAYVPSLFRPAPHPVFSASHGGGR